MAVSEIYLPNNDPRQWLIYAPDRVQASMRVLEAAGMRSLAAYLYKHREALGKDNVEMLSSILNRMSDSRMDYYARYDDIADDPEVTEALHTFAHLWNDVAKTLNGDDPALGRNAVDKFAASMAHLDERVSGAGWLGPGWIRELARGD